MIAGIVMEIVGYAARMRMHFDNNSHDMTIMNFVCLTLGPAFIAAAIYLSFTRLIKAKGPEHARLNPMTYTILFVCLDFVCLVLQGTGGGLVVNATSLKMANDGNKVMLGGLAFQVLSLLIFMGLMIDYQCRHLKYKKQHSSAIISGTTPTDLERRFGWMKAFQTGLIIAGAAVLFRSVYRLVELHDGFFSSAALNETAFVVMEGPLIIIACTALSIYHPGVLFKHKASERLRSSDQCVKHVAEV